ncbi:MAG: hypothetical protein CBC48_01160 [bacterium TMED88]|nr:cytochrome C [Deltaproteobacteria bacterium]OUV36986.1 MAG: hypothetical protein CBC48_01160 [bacterium TMED88]
MSLCIVSTKKNRLMNRRPWMTGLVLISAWAILGVQTAQAADDEAWIEYRQTVMSAIGADMAGIGDILKNGLPLTKNIEFHATAIATNARLVASAFSQRAENGQTDALPDIWQKTDAFAEATDEMREAAEQLAAAVAEGNDAQIGPRVKTLGKSCGSCHKAFRKPKKDSYKNK